MRPDELDAAIKVVAKKVPGIGFGGACAAFAVALNRVLSDQGEYVAADDDSHYEYVSHIALKFEGELFDGSGRISPEHLRSYGHVFEIDGSEDEILRLVDDNGVFNTSGSTDRIEKLLSAALARLAPRRR